MGNKAMKAMMAAGGLPVLGDAEAWARIGAWWRDKGEFEDDLEQRINELEAAEEEHEEQMQAVLEEAKAARESVAEMQHARDMSARGLAAARQDNEALRKVIDKFTRMMVPDERGHMSHGADEQKWHSIMRAILNEARRALATMEAGK